MGHQTRVLGTVHWNEVPHGGYCMIPLFMSHFNDFQTFIESYNLMSIRKVKVKPGGISTLDSSKALLGELLG